ncbi:conjugal transfer protein TrbL, partial [Bradyrhizobium sp. Leo121]
AGGALASAARDKAIGAPGAYAGSLLGLANAKLEKGGNGTPTPSPQKYDN